MDPVRRLASQQTVAPWLALAAVGAVAFALAVWNFAREVSSIGLEAGPVLAAAVGLSLTSGVVYTSLRIRSNEADLEERWVVVVSALGGGTAFTLSEGLALGIKIIEGRPVSEPLLPILVVGSLGTLGGVMLGQSHVEVRRKQRSAERSRDAIAFTNSLLRHDVRNSLQILIAHVNRLSTHDDDSVVDSARSMRSQTDSIQQLLSEVESLSEVLTADLETEPVDLADVLESVAEQTRAGFEHVTVETDRPERLVVEGADGLYPVFNNLVKNAVQHADDDSVHVEVTAKQAGDRAVARVADDGPGIPEGQREAVFERGVTSDGGGHGLYVAETIVEALDGDIYVEESHLGGATFAVDLPLADEHDEGTDDDPFAGTDEDTAFAG